MDLVEGPRPADDNKPMMLAQVDAAAVPELRGEISGCSRKNIYNRLQRREASPFCGEYVDIEDIIRLDQDMARQRQLAKSVLRPIAENVLYPPPREFLKTHVF